MQTLIHVLSSKNRSLRSAIGGDPKLSKFHLQVSERKKIGRTHGWAKLHSTLPERGGAVNIEWNGSSRMLLCRIVTRADRPSLIVGDLVNYLLARFRSSIDSVSVRPR
jgi:hypothetical protein